MKYFYTYVMFEGNHRIQNGGSFEFKANSIEQVEEFLKKRFGEDVYHQSGWDCDRCCDCCGCAFREIEESSEENFESNKAKQDNKKDMGNYYAIDLTK